MTFGRILGSEELMKFIAGWAFALLPDESDVIVADN